MTDDQLLFLIMLLNEKWIIPGNNLTSDIAKSKKKDEMIFM